MESVLRGAELEELAPDGKEWGNLRKVAIALVMKAAGGDVPAIKEIFDRIDGKVLQAVDLKVEGDGLSLDNEARAARAAALLDLARERRAGEPAGGADMDGASRPADPRTTH